MVLSSVLLLCMIVRKVLVKIAPIRITIPTYRANIIIPTTILSPIDQLQKACETFKDYFHPSCLRKYAPSIYSMPNAEVFEPMVIVMQRQHMYVLVLEVLHGAPLPEAHVNGIEKKTTQWRLREQWSNRSHTSSTCCQPEER